AIIGLCEWALDLDGGLEHLEAGLDDLRVVDAKYRLAFVLCRAAQLDEQRGELQRAKARAEEALSVASALDHPSEIALSRITLASLAQATGDTEALELHTRALEPLMPLASAEARNKAQALAGR